MDPKYNTQMAFYEANRAQRLPINEAAPIYEKLLAAFPSAGNLWKQYADAQIAANNIEAASGIFARCLMNCLHFPLWLSYINFMKKVNSSNGADGQAVVKQAFEFMVGCVGEDMQSGLVWSDYIAFLKTLPGNNVVSLRNAYQKAVATPIHDMYRLWNEYQVFEKDLNKDSAKKLLSEYRQKFNSANAVYMERKKLVNAIDWYMLAVPPSCGTNKEELQLVAWNKLIAFDKENRQRIANEASNKRIVLTYEQCLMYFYHYPEMWYDYAMWLAKSGSVDAAVKVFERALKAVPDSELLRYGYAEFEESRGAIKAAKKIYENLLGDGNVNTAPELAQIQFLRFLRRTEGREAARSYFLESRKSPKCTYNLYVAYATVALCVDKDPKLAINVFEAGMQHFVTEPQYILEYVDLLIRLNDDSNTRALFERVLCSMPPEKSVEIWDRFVKFEQTYGDLATMLKIEQRRKEAMSKIGGAEPHLVHDLVSRYSFKNLCPKDSGSISKQESIAKSVDKKMESSSTVLNEAKPVVSNPVAIPSQNPVAGNVQTRPATGGDPKFGALLKNSPALAAFLVNMPQQVQGPIPEVDDVLSFCLQSDVPSISSGSNLATGRKRKGQLDDEDDDRAKRLAAAPTDIFKRRMIQKEAQKRRNVSHSGSSSSSTSGNQTMLTRHTI